MIVVSDTSPLTYLHQNVPAYTVGEAAHYLQIPTTTLRSWVKGRTYPLKPKPNRAGFFEPVVQLPN